jgi:DNA-binding transcriptional MerR regulator
MLEGAPVTLMTIGEFAETTRLSPKALRLYDQLALVVPARVDTSSGYRLYSPDQVETARLVGTLRRLDMPLAVIASVLELDGADAALAISRYWQQVEAVMADRRALVSYLQARLRGDDQTMYDIEVRRMPARHLLTISRHVTIDRSDAFFHEAFARLRAAGPGLEGVAGVPFLVFYGEVSEDSDGPMELCRPLALESGPDTVEGVGDLQLRLEAEHDEAYIRLAAKDMSWPAMLPAYDALQNWVSERHRQPAGTVRQLLIADQRTASPTTLVCDLSVPLR